MLKIHHIGIVVRDIEAYLSSSPYHKSSDVVYDPHQHSNICMLDTGQSETPVELIEPIDEKSTTYQYLKKNGNGTHHICYQIDDLESLERYMGEHKLKRIYGPVEAVVFGKREVVFGYSRTQGIVEFLISD